MNTHVCRTGLLLILSTQHPFTNVPGEFLTATTHLSDPANVLAIAFGANAIARAKTDPGRVWCVRGGQGFEGR